MRHTFPLLLFFSACTAPVIATDPPIVVSLGEIETDATGRCFALTTGPTQTNIVEELTEVVPADVAPDGTVRNPAIFRTITRPQTVTTGPGTRFETVCPPVYTDGFVSSLQRALLIRRAYAGPITGQYDEATSVAVQVFQRGSGIDSPLLAADTARHLGILEVPRNQ